MFLFEFLKSSAVLMSLYGSHLVSQPTIDAQRRGFGMWLVANTIWVINAIILQDWQQTILWIAYNITAYRGYVSRKQ
jgi:hypothetical protein